MTPTLSNISTQRVEVICQQVTELCGFSGWRKIPAEAKDLTCDQYAALIACPVCRSHVRVVPRWPDTGYARPRQTL